MRARFVPLLVALAVAASGCGGGAATAPTTTGPRPAGPEPSAISRQVCSAEAQTEMASALGERAVVSVPTWSDQRYGCTYTYPTGSFDLAVKELSSWPQTDAYVAGLAASLGKSRDLAELGQAAFQAPGGSVVVRKDWKVLVVDPSRLPPQFGVPPTPAGAVAVTVADVILGCWAGD